VSIGQLHAQAFGIGVPSQFLSALPYLATVVVLVLISRNRRLTMINTPASLGQPFVPDRESHGHRQQRTLMGPRANQQRTPMNEENFSLALMTTAAAIGFAAGAQAQDKLKACWVYVGPIGDFGYSYQHDQGRLSVEKELGDKVETPSSKTSGRPRRRARLRALRPRRLRIDLRHLVRLHGCHFD
jgi:hypothetical protein